MLDKGETLLTVSKLHKVPVDTLMRWNGILDMRQVHLGMKLIVKKGDPNVPTEAEKFAAERELRLSRGRTYAAKKLKESTINTGILSKYVYWLT